MTDHVRIYEVGPRDGLQNEKVLIPTDQKVALIDMLSQAGFEKIEATSFVSPKWVPQMADAAGVMAGIRRSDRTDYAVLTPNMKGFEAAFAAGADEVAIFTSASETFCQKNINCSVAESLLRFEPIMSAARDVGLLVRGYISCVAECPYDGPVSPGAVRDVASELDAMGCYELSLGDTIGRGRPETIRPMIEAVLERVPATRLAGHFHDTGDTALANVKAALALGIRTFDSAVGGLGGCPYAPGAKGNVSTTALLEMLEAEGVHTGINREALRAAEDFLVGMTGARQFQKGTLDAI